MTASVVSPNNHRLLSQTALDWLVLSLIPGISSRTLLKLQRVYPTAADILSFVERGQWRHMGLSKSATAWLDAHGQDIKAALSDQLTKTEQWVANGGTVISWQCDRYPDELKHIYDPPVILYILGKFDALRCPHRIAMVGSRKATRQGVELAHQFASQFSEQGWQVVSGMALGIDAAAHQGVTYSHQKLRKDNSVDQTDDSAVIGSTIAVVATGLDQIYPPSHKALQRQILEVGCVISEFPLGTLPKANFFPRRNRIISGLSKGVVVVEASLKSGSLVTARCALEQNRDVFAVPGALNNPQAEGCHHLIQQGATLVTSVDQILEELDGLQSHDLPDITRHPSAEEFKGDLFVSELATAKERLTPSHQAHPAENEKQNGREDHHDNPILMAIGKGHCSADELIARTGLGWPELSKQLLILELSGQLRSTQGGYSRTE